MDAVTNQELLVRAMSAYYRAAPGGQSDQPSPGASGVEKRKGLKYVVLRNVNGVLAVYRIRNDGMLKRLKRHGF